MDKEDKMTLQELKEMREMEIPAEEINSVWGSNLQIGISEGRAILGLPEQTSREA